MATTSEEYYFEGPEKLLEVWFKPPVVSAQFGRLLSKCGTPITSPPTSPFESRESSPPASPRVKSSSVQQGLDVVGLRQITRDNYADMLKLVRCTILGTSTHEFIDSYVLSESSMFVTPYRLILKTCGQTSLLQALPKLIELAAEVGLTEIAELFYSRRSYSRPDLQLFPHRTFEEETEYMKQHFSGGKQFTLGSANDDNWHLYLLNNDLTLHTADHTFEMIMRNLDQDAMEMYYKKNDRTGASVTKDSGIGDLFPGAHTDDFLFDPCGYSVNGILGEGYFTIHITPQQEFSYVSFETDIPVDSYDILTEKVLKIFKPKQFIATLFSNGVGGSCPVRKGFAEGALPGYTLVESHITDLTSYALNYATYKQIQ